MGISVTLKYFRLLLFRCKIFFRKHFFYFPVFSTTENRDQTKSIFWLTKKTLFNFRKIISPIYYYFFKKKNCKSFFEFEFLLLARTLTRSSFSVAVRGRPLSLIFRTNQMLKNVFNWNHFPKNIIIINKNKYFTSKQMKLIFSFWIQLCYIKPSLLVI